MNIVSGELLEGGAGHALLKLADGTRVRAAVDASALRPGEKVSLGVRPEHFAVAPAAETGAPNILNTRVTFVESLGSTTHAYCEGAGAEEALTCELDGRLRPRSGDALALRIPEDACYCFDAQGRALRRLAVQSHPLAA
jgi:multiple sugar transport system ATP-binding protein